MTTKLRMQKDAGKLLVLSIAMGMWWCDAGCIAQWSTSRASLEATRCCHWASVCAILPRQQTWLAILVVNTKHEQKLLLAS
jgi:hypothetical protein